MSETARAYQIEADARSTWAAHGAARWEDDRPHGSWGTLIVTQPPPPPGWVPPAAPVPGPPPPGHDAPSAVYGPPVHKPGVVALRPLGLGDFFDGAFKTIRGNPVAMVGLAALVTTVFMVVPTVVTLLLAAAGHLTFDLQPTPASGGGCGRHSADNHLEGGGGLVVGGV